MLRTALCNLLGIEFPVIQGGMAYISTFELASAVSNTGGLGVVGSGHADDKWVKEQIRQTRERTSKPFGVNIIMTSPFIKDVVQTIIQEKVQVVTCGGGNPGRILTRLLEAGIKTLPVVSTVAAAQKMDKAGAAAVIAEGMESGGKIGETTTMALVPQVVDAVRIPVIAAGGIADGRGLAAALALGAQGVQMGTRFVCSTEAAAHLKYKQEIVKAGDCATTVCGAARSLKNMYTQRFQDLEASGVTLEELAVLSEGKTRLGLVEGNLAEGSLLAGQIAGLVKDIRPVKDIIRDIINEAENVIQYLSQDICLAGTASR